MPEEGLKFAVFMVACFTLLAAASFWALFNAKVDVATLKDLYIALGVMAALFGVPAAIQTFMNTRGQTSVEQPKP